MVSCLVLGDIEPTDFLVDSGLGGLAMTSFLKAAIYITRKAGHK